MWVWRRLKAARGNADSAVVTSKRQFTTVLFALLTVIGTASPLAAAEDEESIVFAGGGWGHGIGLSQYGAYGQALEGKSAYEIVAHYYEGSATAQIVDQVGSESWMITDARPLWINLLAAQTVFTFAAVGGPLTVCHSGAGGCGYTAQPGETWEFVALGDGTCRFLAGSVPVTAPAACKGAVTGMSPGGAHIEIGGLDAKRDEFARGVVRLRSPDEGASFHVALEINLETYLYGLAEVPFSWHTEALRAQALAGRSYAAWKMLSHGAEPEMSATRRAQCWCHMFATTADQSYSGWANEAAPRADRWRGAVNSTAGTIITHPDASQANIVAAFYSSSTGGRTENIEDMWGGSAVTYLRSQADPWSQDPAVRNPFGSWAFPFTENELAAEFGVDKIDGIEIVSRFDSGTPSAIDIHARSDGDRTTLTRSGPELFTILGLRGRNISRLDYGNVPSLAGDFDGDGRDDVAMMTGFNDTWWVGISKPGDFTMAAWLNHTRVGTYENLVAGDFNGDGRRDVATVQADIGKLLVGLSTGGRFQLAAWANHKDPSKWGPVLVGDFDGDGADDLAEYERVGKRWRVYRLRDGELTREFWYDFAVANPNWATHVTGDFDGNGADDVLSLDANTGDLIALFSDGTGFTPSTWQTLPGNGPWRWLRAADFTGDQRTDLAAFDSASATWWVVAGSDGTDGLAPEPWFTFANGDQAFVEQVAGDFNDDGKADVAAYVTANGKLKVLLSDGTSFSKAVWGVVPARSRVTEVHAVDVNGDGKTDVAAWDNALRRWWVARAKVDRFKVTPWGTLLR